MLEVLDLLVVASTLTIWKRLQFAGKYFMVHNRLPRKVGDVHEEMKTIFFFLFIKCCFTSTDTLKTIRDGEPRTATSTFTQYLSSALFISSSVLLYVHRDRTDY